jgi:magnesium chelatase family protein
VAFQGLKVLPIDVQVQIAHGMPNFTVVGLPDKSIAESRERIRSALTAIGLALPAQRITVNLSPADQVKEGSHYDLPIVIGILCTMNVLPAEECQDYVALGEVALDGTLIPTAGTLATALHCLEKDRGIICPAACGGEAAWAKGVEIIAPHDLLSLIHHFKGQHILSRPEPLLDEGPEVTNDLDLSDIRGQEVAKRALFISAVGRHNLLLSGPPGSGKSMLAARLSQLLPPLSPQEALEVTMIHSMAGVLKEGRLLKKRPFRAPHHS